MMSLQNNLRVALVYLTLSIVGCFSELPVVGDASGNEDEMLQLENTNIVNQLSQITIRDTFQKNLAAFKIYHQPRVNLVPHSQRSDRNAKKTSFSYIEPRHTMDVIRNHAIQPKVNSGHNLELTGDSSNAKNRYAFQRIQQKPNVLNFTRSLKSTSDFNSASGIIKKEVLLNGTYVYPKVYTSGEFSKSEMYSHSSQPFDFNVVQPVIRPGKTRRTSMDYMFRNVSHDIRQKNNGDILNDNIRPIAGQNEKASRKVLPVGESLAFVRANKKVDTPSPHSPASGTPAFSQISNDNIRYMGLSKVFSPQIPAATAVMSKPRAFTKSHSDVTQRILPLKKSNFFSNQRDPLGQQDYNRNFSPKANQQSSFESTNVSINAFKGFQDSQDSQTASLDAYQSGVHSQDPTVQDFHSQRKYDNLAKGASAIRSPVANIARSYKVFPSAKTSSFKTIRQKQSIASNGKATYSFPRIQLAKAPLVISEPETTQVKTKIQLPATVPSSPWMSSQYSTGRGNPLISSGRSTAQSLFIKNPVPDGTMKISQHIGQSVSGTQGIFKHSHMSTSQNRPYYLTSKKPNTFKGFTFFPTEQAPGPQTETYSGPKSHQSSFSNGVQFASAHPRSALSVPKEEKHLAQSQNPLISNSLTEMHGKQSGWDQLDAVRAHDTVSSTNTSKHQKIIGQATKAVYPGSTTIPEKSGSNNNPFYLQNNLRGGYNTANESHFKEHPLEISQTWTSGILVPAQNTQAFAINQKGLGLWKSSQATTSVRSENGRFSRPNIYRNLFMKSNNVSSVSSSASNALNTYISTVATGTKNANTSPEFPSVYRKTSLSQGSDFTRNIQLPTRHGSINETVSLKPDKFNSDTTLLSHFVPPIHRSTDANKVTGYPFNAGVQPQSIDVKKNIKANPTMNRNASDLIQLNTNESYNVMPTSNVVIGREVEANREVEHSENNSFDALPTTQSAINRSASIHEADSSSKPVYLPTIYRSVIKSYGKAKIFNTKVGPELMKNETRISANRTASGMEIDLSTVGVSQTLRPTSSFVVGKFVKALEKDSTKGNLNASQTNGLQNLKPVRFVDIAGSASFSNIKPSFSAVVSKMGLQNISTSTPWMDESVTELPFAMTADSFTVVSDLQENIENGLQSTVSISNPWFMPTAVNTDPELLFTEVTAEPQTTVHYSELETDPGNQTTQAFDKSQTVLGSWKSSQATTSERSTNGRFSRPNIYRTLFMKSNNVSSVSSSASNALNTYISTVATGTANTFPEFPSVYRKTGLSQAVDFMRNIQLPTRHGSINETVSLKPDKFNSDTTLLSHFVPPIHRSTVANKVTGYPFNAGVQPQSIDVKNIKANPTMNRNADELTQLNTNESYNVMRLRPTSNVVIGREVEANREVEHSENNSFDSMPTTQSAIYRSTSIHEANSSAKPVYLPTIYRSVIKSYGKAKIFNANVGPDLMKNESLISANRTATGMEIDLSAVGVSQTLRPTSSFVVGKFVKALEKDSTKGNLNASQTNGLQNLKPVRFVDIAGSASFSNIKPSFSAVISKMGLQNISTSTPWMDESVTELPFAMTADSFTVVSDLQENIENDLQSTVSISNPWFMPTAVNTDPELLFTEVTVAPQTTVHYSELETDPGNQTTQAFDKSQTVLGSWKSSQATTSERSTNGRFSRPNIYRTLFMKSNNVSSVSSSASNALNTYISTVATGTANTFPEFPSVYRKTGLSQAVDFMRNIQLPTRHGSINETVSLKPDKFNSDTTLLSHFVPPIHRSTDANKVTGYPFNAGVQPQSIDVKNIKANPTMNRNADELTQLNTNESYNVMRLRPTSNVVIGRGVEANREVEHSENNSFDSMPTTQSAIYRSTSIHEANSSAKPVYLPTIYRSVIKSYGKAKIFNANVGPDLMKNESLISANRTATGMEIDLSAVGVSQTLRPTSSFVVGKFVKALEKDSTKGNLNASQTNGLQNLKPVRFVDIAGSASFSNIKPSFSAVISKMGLQNISTSTPWMDESVTELPFAMTADSFTVVSDLQENIENDLQSTVSISNPWFMPTAVNTDPELLFTEVTVAPQTTVHYSELETDPGNQTTQAFDKSQTVLGSWKSSQATTSERSTNGRFSRPNIYRTLFMKSNNVSSVSSSASNALNTYISTVATGTANTFPEFPSVYRKTGLSQAVDFMRNIQLPTRHGSINETVSLKPDKFNSDTTLLSHFVPPIHRSTVANKVTGYPFNAGVQPQSIDVKTIKANPTMNRNADELTQLNTNESYNVMRLRPTSNVVIGREVEANKKVEHSENNSFDSMPTTQSAIYRSTSIHEANSSAKPVYLPTIYRSVIKSYGKAKIFNANVGPDLMKNESLISANRTATGMEIDLSAVGVSQTLRPTSSFVVGKFVKALEKDSTKGNLNASQTNGLQNLKPVRFVDIAGSASFSNIKPSFSAVISKMGLQNISTSTPWMDESVTELPFAMTADSFTVVSDLQENIENGLQSTVSISNPWFMPTAVNTDPELLFTEVTAAPQTTVHYSELETDPGNQTTPTAENIIPFYEGILIPNTTMLVTMTSE